MAGHKNTYILYQRISEEMERDLTGLTAKLAKIEDQNNADILEIKNSINSLNIAFIKFDTALQFITKEIKKDKE